MQGQIEFPNPLRAAARKNHHSKDTPHLRACSDVLSVVLEMKSSIFGVLRFASNRSLHESDRDQCLAVRKNLLEARQDGLSCRHVLWAVLRDWVFGQNQQRALL